MPSIDLSLALLGHEITGIAGGSRFRWPPPTAPWRVVRSRAPMHRWTDTAPGSQAGALYRLRQTVGAGRVVMIMADAGRGRVLFELPLPGRPLAVRAGWFALRRLTGVPTLPVLGHREGRRWVVEVHPAVPAPDPDERRDREACRDALGQLLGGFVARFREQCHFLGLSVDERPALGSAAAAAAVS
jgi:hypothetical protein